MLASAYLPMERHQPDGTGRADEFAHGHAVAVGTTDTLTLAVKDAAGNAIADLFTGDFILSISGGTSTGRFGTVAETATPGTYTVVFKGVTAGTPSELSVEVTGILPSKKPKVTVTA